MSRKRSTYDLGNAISIEDALSIMIVTFVLFVLFLIPLVNIDRAKLEEAQQDIYWKKLSEWIRNQECIQDAARPYIHAFNLHDNKICASKSGGIVYIEALSSGGELTVIEHKGNGYISLVVKEQSTVVTYRYGDIRWSGAEKEWFTVNNNIDYGEKNFTITMQKEFRTWTKENRGF